MNNIKKTVGGILCAIILIMPSAAGAQDFQTMEPAYEVPEPCNKYVEKLEAYDWDTSMAIRIAMKESRCNEKGHNPKDGHKGCIGSWSLMNVGCVHYKKGESHDDLDLNIEKSYKIYIDSGRSFGAWTTCKLVKGCK